MGLSKFITPPKIPVLVTYAGGLLKLFAGLLVPSLFVSLAFGEFGRTLLFAGAAAGTFLTGWLAARVNRRELELKEALMLVALGYLLYALMGGLLFLGHEKFIDGFFEAMSGFTTTGLSVADLETLPKSLLFFRAWSQWIGGAGIAVLSIAVLVSPGKASLQILEAGARKESLIGSVKKTARVVTVVYGILTSACFAAYLLCGVAAWEALLIALTTVSTGGFTPFPASIDQYHGRIVAAVVPVFMILGAIGLPVYHGVLKQGPRRLFGDPQVRLLGLLLIVSTALGLSFWAGKGSSAGELVFHCVSSLTGTGFSVSAPAEWPEGFQLMAMVLMCIGGCTGSTTGGIKLIRLVILAKLAGRAVERLLLPREAELPVKLQGKAIDRPETDALIAFLALYAGIFLLSSFLLMLHGYSLNESIFESASALGTVGLSSGVTGADLALTAKLLLIFDMWAGRVEILPVAVLLRQLFVSPGKESQ